MTIEIMLDLETMDTEPAAAITAIGAVAFEMNGSIHEEFYKRVDLESAVAAGGTMSAGTVLWWMQQSDAAREELYRKPCGCPIAIALKEFALFVFRQRMRDDSIQLWGNGANFDNVILRSAFKRSGIALPWSPRHDDRCFKTVRKTNEPVQLEPIHVTIMFSDRRFMLIGDVAHHALYDARWQTCYLLAMHGIRLPVKSDVPRTCCGGVIVAADESCPVCGDKE